MSIFKVITTIEVDAADANDAETGVSAALAKCQDSGAIAGFEMDEVIFPGAAPRADCATEIIRYAIEQTDPELLLRLWFYGDFDAIRREWPDCPEACFIGAEVPLSKPGCAA